MQRASDFAHFEEISYWAALRMRQLQTARNGSRNDDATVLRAREERREAMILRYPTGDELGGPIKGYELTEEQEKIVAQIYDEIPYYMYEGHADPEKYMERLARAIAEPLAAEIATLETLNESAKGQIKAQAKRIAELEAELKRYQTADNHKTKGGFTSSSGMYYDV